MNNKIVLLSAGHGNYDKETDINFTPEENGKFFKHDKGEFHRGSTFYEGHKNRIVMDRVYKMLVDAGIRVYKLYEENRDTPLRDRITLANQFYDSFEANFVYVSEHSNASPKHNARGFCVFTSPGVTKSDELATELIQRYKHKFGARVDGRAELIRVREDNSDGDPDYEARFYELVHTKMPAVLIENLFFDQYMDAQLLTSERYLNEYCKLLTSWIIEMSL